MSNLSPVEVARKIERWETGQKYLSVLTSLASFWIITLSWNYYNFGNLEAIPRLGLAAALSWVVFLHAEAVGMLIMTMMKEKWQSEARAERELEFRERELELRERELEMWAQDREDRAREAREREARERERDARERERDALTQDIMRGLMRRLEAVEGGENANGGKA